MLFRLRERDFGEIRHHGGISPAWPLSYADFAPYYDEAERLYLVHGKRGEDPTEPPALGAVSPTRPSATSRGSRGCTTISYAPATRRSTCPSGSTSTSRIRRTARCVRCTHLDGFPCLVDGKADAHVLCIRPALGTRT